MSPMERNLSYLLRKLTYTQRAELAVRLDISVETLERRIGAPGKFTLDDAPILVTYITNAFGTEWDGFELLFGNVSVAQQQARA